MNMNKKISVGKPVRSRMFELDALRGIACLLVVLFHYSIRINPTDSHYLIHYGYMGVDLFFIISGFVIYLTLERTSVWMDFVIHRFSRLYPAYWVAVILTFWVMRLSPFFTAPTPNYLLTFNMTMLQHWIGIKDLDGAYWTLNLELSFYALMLVLYMSKLLKHTYLIVVLLIVPCWLKIMLPGNTGIAWLEEWIPVFRMSYLFAAGLIFFKAYKAMGKYSLIDVLLLIICLSTAWFGRGKPNAIEFIHVCVFFLVFVLFTKNKLKFLATPFLIKMGGLSYSLYLLHENIGWEMLKGLEYMGVKSFYVSRAIAVVAMIILSYLVSVSIEKPAQKFINTSWKKIKNRYPGFFGLQVNLK